MFSLRSSPSTLGVPCSLRGAVAEAGMGLRLTAPRPRRVMPLMYYNNQGTDCGSSSDMGISGGGGGTMGLGCSPSTYAGVFEAGCDPAQVRASLTQDGGVPRCSAALPVHTEEEPSRSSPIPARPRDRCAREADVAVGTAATASFEDHHVQDEEDDVECGDGHHESDDTDCCLFEMEGLARDIDDGRAETTAMAMSDSLANGVHRMSLQGEGIASSADTRTAAINKSAAAVTRSSVANDSGAATGRPAFAGAAAPRAYRAGGAEKLAAPAMYKGASGTHLRAPRIIAPGPGRRCTAGGMYRLRLSTSC